MLQVKQRYNLVMISLRKLLCAWALLAVIDFSLAGWSQAPGEQPSTKTEMPRGATPAELLNEGIAAYNAGQFDAAIQDFKVAVTLNPAYWRAWLYLGTAYSTQTIPGLTTRENLQTAASAINALKHVPETNRDYATALRTMGTVYFNTSQFDEARDAELKLLNVVPFDAEAHYTIGVLDWTMAHRNALAILATEGLSDDGAGNEGLTLPACRSLQEKNSALVQEGIEHLTQAISLKPGYSDAMAYLNLTYRRHADFACGDASRAAEDVELANRWTQEAMTARALNEAAAPAAKQE
jgi:tetratricopeptide (TPR) repeat protein